MIAVILLAVALVALASWALLRSSQPPARKPKINPGMSEREVYERLYGDRSRVVSAAELAGAGRDADARASSPFVMASELKDGRPLD